MNTEAKEQINRILVTYLDIIEDAQTDLVSSYALGPVEYMRALERHEKLAASIGVIPGAVDQISCIGAELVAAPKE